MLKKDFEASCAARTFVLDVGSSQSPVNKHSWLFWEMDLTSLHQSRTNKASSCTELMDKVFLTFFILFWFKSDQMKKIHFLQGCLQPRAGGNKPPSFGNMSKTSSLDDLSMLDYQAVIYWAAFCWPEPPTRRSQWCLCLGMLEECMI